METVKRTKTKKKQFSLQKLSSTTTGMDAVDDFFTNHPFVDKAGRRTFSTYFKKDHFLDLMIVNFENVASQKCVPQKGKNL